LKKKFLYVKIFFFKKFDENLNTIETTKKTWDRQKKFFGDDFVTDDVTT